MSLDGYIAGPNGEYDWIEVDPSSAAGYFKAFYAYDVVKWRHLGLRTEVDGSLVDNSACAPRMLAERT